MGDRKTFQTLKENDTAKKFQNLLKILKKLITKEDETFLFVCAIKPVETNIGETPHF